MFGSPVAEALFSYVSYSFGRYTLGLTTVNPVVRMLVPFVFCVAVLAQHEGHEPNSLPEEGLGRVHMETTCAPVVAAQFDRALALLHNFWYARALERFDQVAAADPGCALAYWGAAMTYNHPFWDPPSPADEAAAWALVQKGLSAAKASPREKAYVAAVAALYQDGGAGSKPARDQRYRDAMAAAYASYPDDETSLFYGLSILGSVQEGTRGFEPQEQAAKLFEGVFSRQPDHPGVLHYLIHTYDYPPLAQRGLAAANRYAEVAPAAQHAQHMPSHTYSMLGMWAQSVASNTKSRAVAQKQAAKLWPGATHPSEPHHLDFMEYALLQMGQEGPAKQLRDDSNSIKKLGFEILASHTALAAVPARFALERQAWKEAAALEPRGSQFPQAEAITYFARAMGSARSGDLGTAEREVDKLKEIRAALENASQSYWATQVEVQMLAASAWIAQGKGDRERALKLMREAADVEDDSAKHIAMENRLYPMRELLGDPLLEQQQPGPALAEYETSLASTPNRLRGLYGAAKSANAGNQPEKAAAYFRNLAEMTKDAGADRVEISEAKASVIQR